MYGPEHTFLAVEAAQDRVVEDSLEDIVVGQESASHAAVVVAGTGDMAGKAAVDAAVQEILYLDQEFHVAEDTPHGRACVASHVSVVACAAEAGAAVENIHAPPGG